MTNRSTPEYIIDSETGCWEWQRAFNNRGYPTKWILGRKWLAHRLYYTLANGLISPDMTIDHLCRNKACVNPAHLEMVTACRNLRRGVRTTLNEQAVIEMRARYKAGERTAALAAEYGATKAAVYQSCTGSTWTKEMN